MAQPTRKGIQSQKIAKVQVQKAAMRLILNEILNAKFPVTGVIDQVTENRHFYDFKTDLLSRIIIIKKQTPWPESANELYRPSDRRLSAKVVPTFADRGCHMVSVTDPYSRILGIIIIIIVTELMKRKELLQMFYDYVIQTYCQKISHIVPDEATFIRRKLLTLGTCGVKPR
jgi:hypothetical protein